MADLAARLKAILDPHSAVHGAGAVADAMWEKLVAIIHEIAHHPELKAAAIQQKAQPAPEPAPAPAAPAAAPEAPPAAAPAHEEKDHAAKAEATHAAPEAHQ